MHRRGRCILVSLLALASATASQAQPAPAADELDSAYAALDALAAREKAALEARERAFAQMRDHELAAQAAVTAEARARQAQMAQLQRTEAELRALLDRVEQHNARPRRLLLEKAVLEDWYATLQPAVASLTERSFRGAELELDALAAAGAIEPGPHRFRSYLELRNAIAALNQRLAQEQAARAAEQQRLRTEFEAVRAREQQQLRDLLRPSPASETAAQQWLDAGAVLAARADALDKVRAEIAGATQRILDAAGRQRPPVLLSASASIDGREVYRGTWQRGGGAAGTEAERERRRAQLRAEREQVQQQLLELGQLHDIEHAALVESAESMHRLGQMLSRSADRYADKRMQAAQITVAVEIGTTVLELLVTGGAATLARQAEEKAVALAQREARKSVGSRVHAELVGEITDEVANTVTRAAAQGAQALRAQAAERVRTLVAGGMAEAEARALVAKETEAMARQLLDAQRAQRIAAAAAAAAPAPMGGQLAEPLAGVAVTTFASGVTGQLAQGHPPALEHVDNFTPTVYAEAVDAALSQAWNIAKTPASDSAASLRRASTWASKARNSFRPNLAGTVVGAATGAYKAYVAQQLDAGINRESEFFAVHDTELTAMYGLYRIALEHSRQTDQHIGELRAQDAGLRAALLVLDGGMDLQATSTAVAASPEQELALELRFSAPLPVAPTVAISGAQLGMQRADGSGLRWRGVLPVARLGTSGSRQVTVNIGVEQSLHGSLDRDPRTPALRLARRGEWNGFETGADENHRFAFTRRDGPSTPPPIAPATSGDPFEEGRALVDGGAAALTAQQLAGTWVASGYSCNGDEPPELIEIAASGNRLVATKLRGDRCVRSGEITWRGTLSGKTITGEVHLRAMDAVNEGEWSAGTLEVVSEREIRGFNVTYRRQ